MLITVKISEVKRGRVCGDVVGLMLGGRGDVGIYWGNVVLCDDYVSNRLSAFPPPTGPRLTLRLSLLTLG